METLDSHDFGDGTHLLPGLLVFTFEELLPMRIHDEH